MDVIHSDGTANLLIGLGLMQPIGHVDFYPNGGKDQPECPQTSGKIISAIFSAVTIDVQGLEDGLGCSHTAAVYFYIDSIRNYCNYVAYTCASQGDFLAGKCLRCISGTSCNRMGYYSSLNKDTGSLYLNTQPPLSEDFQHSCKQNYLVELTSNKVDRLVQTRGKITIYFQTVSDQVSSIEVLDDAGATFKPDESQKRLVSLNVPLNDTLESVYVSFTKTGNLLSAWMYDNKWSFRYVTVLNGERQETIRFCPVTSIIESGKTVKFEKC